MDSGRKEWAGKLKSQAEAMMKSSGAIVSEFARLQDVNHCMKKGILYTVYAILNVTTHLHIATNTGIHV